MFLFNHLRGVLDSRSPDSVGIDLRPAAQLGSTQMENISERLVINIASADKMSAGLDAAGDKISIISTARFHLVRRSTASSCLLPPTIDSH